MRGLSRELLAEFLGTFVLIVFGVGVVAQIVLSRQAAGTPLSINIAWGLAVTMGCYVSAGVTRRAPQSGGDAGARRPSPVSVEQGPACTRSRSWPARSSRRRSCT